MGIYVCGPTTYNYIHVGNGRTFLVFDMVRRYLMYRGYKVTYVQNLTDIDDKIINRAHEEKMDPHALAEKYIAEFYKDCQVLNILPADVQPKATEHISEMIKMIETLEDNGLAYAVDGDVYYAVNNLPQYGKLSGRTLEDMMAGARVEVDERKHHPMDFALWKSAKPGEPSWDSPWGKGRPGWHIECSAMALKYLGEGLDIHGGGADLVFPHHENEIAQAEGCSCGSTYARYWMHGAFLTINQQKMSKSLGNFFTVREITEHFPGEVVRFYLLSTHYRSQLDFDDEKLVMAQKGLNRLQTSVRLANEVQDKLAEEGTDDQELIQAGKKAREDFIAAMDDDFNSALAYAALFDLAKQINHCIGQRTVGQHALAEAKDTLLELGGVLGFDFAHPAAVGGENEDDSVSQVMEVMLKIRAHARKKKDWEMADMIRDSLKEIGIVLEDTPQGARWTFKQ